MQNVGSINTYLGLTKDEMAGEVQPVIAPSRVMQTAQPRILVLSVLNGNPNGLTFDALQSQVGPSMLSGTLHDLVSDLRTRNMVEVEMTDDPLNPTVKVTGKGQEQLSLWS